MLRIFSFFHRRTDEDDVTEQLIHELTIIGKLAFYFTIDTIRFIINFCRLYFYWFILLAVVFVLFAAREVSLETLHYTGIITLDIAGVIDTVVDGVIGVLNDFADAISAISFGSVSVHVSDIDLESKLGVMEEAKQLLGICDSIDTMSYEVFHTLKLNTHKVCSVVRYMYPVNFVYQPLKTMLGWMIFDPSPVGQPGCEPPKYYELCYIFNFYQMVKFFSYLLFWITLISSYIRTINFFFENVLFQLITFVLRAIHALFTVLWHVIRKKKPPTQQLNQLLSELLV
jgi:hypothetical protein